VTKRQFFLVWLVSISLLGYFTPSVRGEVRGEENIIYEFSDVADSDDNALRLMKDMAEGRRKVRAWWGPTFEDTIHVFVGRKYRIQTSLVPAWRGNRGHFYINSRRVRDNLVTTIHNLIHIYAPNGNRLLAEGLAVYAHNRLGGPPGRPDYGRDLHQLAVEHADSFDLVHWTSNTGLPGLYRSLR
jgi:hypothetical protein